MKINLINNYFNKYLDINISEKNGILLDNFLNNCSLLIYNIENCEIITDNNIFLLGEKEAPFNITFEKFMENNNLTEENIKKIVIKDRIRDENGNVKKENKTIENYNKWFQYQENENFIQYIQLPTHENSHIIRYPISSLLENILQIPSIHYQPIPVENINNEEINYSSEEETKEEQNIQNDENNLINEVINDVINNNVPSVNEIPLNQFNNLIDVIDNYIRNTEHLYINEILPTLDNFNHIILNEDVKITINNDDFEKLERVNFNETHKNMDCLICLETFQEEESLIKINCNHIFHCDCIKHWICEESNKCPVCRVEVLEKK